MRAGMNKPEKKQYFNHTKDKQFTLVHPMWATPAFSALFFYWNENQV